VGLFSRTPKVPIAPPNFNDPTVGDAQWLADGESRYSEQVKRHFGSPDTIAAGGDGCRAQNDNAAALYFYAKAIDTLHSIYACGGSSATWNRQPSGRDITIIDRYLETLATIKAIRPLASPARSLKEVNHRVSTISSSLQQNGLDATPYLRRLESLGSFAADG
jgi:hypothetical protein